MELYPFALLSFHLPCNNVALLIHTFKAIQRLQHSGVSRKDVSDVVGNWTKVLFLILFSKPFHTYLNIQPKQILLLPLYIYPVIASHVYFVPSISIYHVIKIIYIRNIHRPFVYLRPSWMCKYKVRQLIAT